MSRTLILIALPLLAAAPAAAQEMDHSRMNHSAMAGPAAPHSGHDGSAGSPWQAGSGTARLPGREAMMHGPMTELAGWELMLHGAVSGQYTDVSGGRGDDKFYVTSMAMGSAEKALPWGKIALRAMMSLEPAMDPRGYPNLFATGETANGLALVDRQHPHDLFMELAGRVDLNNADQTTLFVYGGPVGEPALGPSAFMHRASAKYNPDPPITHHWFDSTHITYGVVTAGISAAQWQIEGSAFRGREPDEARWNIETPDLDSWSVRATFNPAPRWAVQASYGEIHQPEALHPGEDEHRFTASAHYNDGHGLAMMAAYSAKRRVPGETLPAWLGEVNWDIDRHNTLFGRIENVKNDELFPDHDDPLHDTAFRVTKLQAGAARRLPLRGFELALGGSVATFLKPAALDAAYGETPVQVTVFVKLSLGS
ncbi:MAG: hypothetical protein FP826_14050 [Sphingomonadales bacterium]|nr:hypothetical protein [Sphingomonadales bacterium]